MNLAIQIEADCSKAPSLANVKDGALHSAHRLLLNEQLISQLQAARFTFARRARFAAAIFRRADTDIVRLAGFELLIGMTFFARTFAQRSLCAAAIFLRAETESVRRCTT
jgi:hypothetical protein